MEARIDHEDRLVPAITTQVLWNQVIQVSGGQQIVRPPPTHDGVRMLM